MSDSNTTPFKQQLTKWWGLVSSKETGESFTKFFSLAWTIIVETGRLVGLFLLGGLVSIGWVVDRSTALTESVKSLQSQADQAEDGNLVAEAGKSLWAATKKGADNALQTARTKLDIKVPEKKTKETVAAKPASQPAAAPTPAPAPKAETPAPAPASTPAPATASEEANQPESSGDEETVRVDDPQ